MPAITSVDVPVLCSVQCGDADEKKTKLYNGKKNRLLFCIDTRLYCF